MITAMIAISANQREAGPVCSHALFSLPLHDSLTLCTTKSETSFPEHYNHTDNNTVKHWRYQQQQPAASLRLVSPGAATDGVTLFFLRKVTIFLIVFL